MLSPSSIPYCRSSLMRITRPRSVFSRPGIRGSSLTATAEQAFLETDFSPDRLGSEESGRRAHLGGRVWSR